ncbi:MAG: hypothetical protein HY394_06570 [Candidatus Diapherotrites archaeon]|nr:hypothetical protein [Candidatus Diapherotrites archaeon]
MPEIARPKRRRPLVVHLGNVGFDEEAVAYKTKKRSERFPNATFIGVDLINPGDHRPPNWHQFHGDFESGLKRLKDGAASIISSEFALGYYGPEGEDSQPVVDHMEYTLRVFNICHKKLCRGGKLMLMVGEGESDFIEWLLRQSAFGHGKITARPLYPKEYGRTPTVFGYPRGAWQITAEK